MLTLQLLFRASPATLLLVLYLQLGISTAQENTTNRRAIILNMELPESVRANEEVSLKLTVETELKECMVIKSYVVSSKPLDGPINYKYTTCLCEDYPRTLYWYFQSNSTVHVAAVVDIVRELNICPGDLAVVPIQENQFYSVKTLKVN